MDLDDIENKLEELIAKLKPSLRDKFDYRFNDAPGEALADALLLKPPIIQFFSERIRLKCDKLSEAEVEDFLCGILFWQLTGKSSWSRNELIQNQRHLFSDNL